jgi:hypothetical protein
MARNLRWTVRRAMAPIAPCGKDALRGLNNREGKAVNQQQSTHPMI